MRMLFAALLGAVVVSLGYAEPRRTLDHYALVGIEGVRARSLTVDEGDVGVNTGRLAVARGLTAPRARLVASAIRLAGSVSCAGAFGDDVSGTRGGCPTVRGGVGTIFSDPGDLCGASPIVPACGATTVEVRDGAPQTLAPGVYGDLLVAGDVAATVDLSGGRYVFCSIRALRNARLRVHGPSEIVVTGLVRIDRGSTLEPAPGVVLGPHDVRLMVAGPRVTIAREARVAARVCAPNARVTVRGARVHGTTVGRTVRAIASTVAAPYVEDREPCSQRSRLRHLYFGDLHVHTALSFDAYAFDVRTVPEEAYGFARGASITLPSQTLQIDRPLDFVAVTDHSEFLGEVELCTTPGSSAYDSADCQLYRTGGNAGATHFGIRTAIQPPSRLSGVCGVDGAACLSTASQVWNRVQQAAADAYDVSSACAFTSFVGYEYTASAIVSTLHRNVVFRSDHVPFPTTVFEQPTRQGLWAELGATCVDAGVGCDVLVIPHNANESNGKMFQVEYPGATTVDDERAQARQRASMEPLMEIYQHKGAGECLAGISGIIGAADEQCAFEQRYLPTFTDCGDGVGVGGTITAGCASRRDYLRGSLLEGLLEDDRIGINPFRTGVIASTDTHNSAPGAVAEDGWPGHRGTDDGTSATRLGEGQFYVAGWRFSPGGLAAVWAEENSRPALFDALRRRETYGTSGPRIAVRFFGGFGLDAGLCSAPDQLEQAYAGGVPMGGTLGMSTASAPQFLVTAAKDPGTVSHPGTPLQRLQIVKLWLEGGERHQQVYEVAGDPDNGATVDVATCEQTGSGFDTLCAVWSDPDFDPLEQAVYYARVLENPSCRWSAFECNRLAPEARPPSCAGPNPSPAVQERAWTSPIWYRPAS